MARFIYTVRQNIGLSVVTIGIAFVFVAIPFVLQHDEKRSPLTLGDWGDYVGGAIAVLAFVWLIAGHLSNQAQIAESANDTQSQLEMTREVVGALATIAAGNKVQAAQVLADSHPAFVFTDSIGHPTGRHTVAAVPTSGVFRFRNDGPACTITGIDCDKPNVVCQVRRTGVCSTGERIEVLIEATEPLRKVWPIDVVVRYTTKFEIAGSFGFELNGGDDSPRIKPGHGLADDRKSPS